jgi:hypothetical protein
MIQRSKQASEERALLGVDDRDPSSVGDMGWDKKNRKKKGKKKKNGLEPKTSRMKNKMEFVEI